MKINAKLLLITFLIITFVSVSTAFIYHTLAQQLLQSHQSKALVNSANDFIFAFQQFVEDIDAEYQSKMIDGNGNIKESNLDFFFTTQFDSIVNVSTIFVNNESKIYKNASTVSEFLKYNTNLVVRNNGNHYYGREINLHTVNKFSEKIRAEIALVEGNVVSRFTSNNNNQYYLPYLSKVSRELKDKNNFEIVYETMDEIDLSATHYSPKASVTSNKEIDFIIFSVSNEASEFKSTMTMITAIIVVSGIFLTVIFLFLFTTKFRKQLDYINHGVIKIAKGELGNRVKVISGDEIGNLGNAFNNMLNEIEKRDNSEKEYLEFISLINKNSGLEEIGEAALNKIISTTSADVGAFYLYNEGKLKPISILGLQFENEKAIDETGFYKKAIDERNLIEIIFTENHPTIKTGITDLKISYLYVLPIFYNSKIISVLELASVNRPNINVKEYLNKIKDQLAIGLANGRSLSELQTLVNELKKLNSAYEEQNIQISNKNNELIQLHEKLKKGSDELEVQTQKAVQSEKLKSQFLANMSHELRTPQNAILGLTELIIKDSSTSAITKERLNVVLRNGKKLLTLIENILEYSKLESGSSSVKYSNIRLSELISEVESFVKPFFIEANLNFNITLPINCDYEIYTDTKKIEQILYNLIGNAVKFTKEGFVKLEVIAKNNDLLIHVTDSGPGISEEDQKIIFNEFTQADAELNRKFSGTGLGLAVCKKYIELLKGSITLESKINSGTKFSVTLPNIIKQKIEITTLYSIEDIKSSSLSGCIISNGTDSTKLIQDYLKSYQLNVTVHKPSVYSFNEIAQLLPDFIIIDILNSEYQGWQILNEIKVHEDLSTIPVIVVNMDEEANCGLGFNVFQYYSKNITREHIYYSIEKIEQLHGLKLRKFLFIGCEEKYELLEREFLHDEIKSYHHNGGLSIIEFTKQKEPDIIFIDLFDEAINTFSILTQLNAEIYTKNIPIIAFIGNLEGERLTGVNNNLLETTLVNQYHPLDVLKVIKERIELIDSGVFIKDSEILQIEKEAKSNAPAEVRKNNELKILIVDDNKDARFTIGEIVKSLGYQPTFAEDGYECLEILNQEIPDLVLLDIMMPKMDGFKTIKEIRKIDILKDLKIYALTAYAMLTDKDIIEKNGFDGLFTKPINGLQLERKLNQIFKIVS